MTFLNRLFLVTLIGSYNGLSAQNLIVNGSFETNTAITSYYDLRWNDPFDSILPGLFFIAGQLDLITTDYQYCNDAKEGSWLIQDEPHYYWGAFSFSLTEKLIKGESYNLTFSARTCSYPSTRWIDIGLSNDSSSMGETIATFLNDYDTTWKDYSLTFIPSEDKQFLTVKVVEDLMSSGAGYQVDDFKLISLMTGIESPDNSSHSLSVFPNPNKGNFNVQLDELPIHPFKLLIYDLTGHLIMSSIISQNKLLLNIQLMNVPAGMCSLVLKNEEKIYNSLLVIH